MESAGGKALIETSRIRNFAKLTIALPDYVLKQVVDVVAQDRA
jgi:hypothetical protein